ncbi:MAG TPA: sugar ABC transporter permease [Propionibacteriaceae bacterium]
MSLASKHRPARNAVTEQPPAPARSGRRPSTGLGLGIALVAPTLVMILAVSLYPAVSTLRLSTRNTSLAEAKDEFIGLGNYVNLLTDSQFWNAWQQTLVFTAVSTVLETVVGMVMALVLFETFRGRGLLRALVLIPWAIPTVVTSRMFGWLFDGQNGVVNFLLLKAGVTDGYVNFLGSTTWAMPTIIVADVWKTAPFMALLILAGLQTIPTSLLESARIDGASTWRTFTSIRLPLLLPALLVAALLRSLDAFRIFDLPYVLTGGGPADSTETLSTLAYKRLFSGLQLGYGSSIATAMFITEVVIALVFGLFVVRAYKTLGDR